MKRFLLSLFFLVGVWATVSDQGVSTLPGGGGCNPFSLQSSPIATAMSSSFKLQGLQPALPGEEHYPSDHLRADAHLNLVGHLNEEKLQEAEELILTFDEAPPEKLVIEVSSTSGDLQDVVRLAQQIYRLKVTRKVPVIVYIDKQALGPAAIFPFLADELYASLVASWGDIMLGGEDLPVNLLRSQVTGLVDETKLEQLADAMIDPSLTVNDQTFGGTGKVISKEGETLILDQQQMTNYGLVKALITPAQFQKRFPTVETVPGTLELTIDTVDDQLAEHIHYNLDGPNTIGFIEIGRGMINQGTWIYVKSALDHYKESKPAFVILRLNTPGGEVFAAQQISDGLKSLDTDYDIPVVAFIDNWAISAGAMLAYSCRFISIVKDAAMGAAEPVMMGGGEVKSASEKVNSALRADFANRAAFFDRNPYIAEAMVDKDIILVLRHGEIVKLDNEDQIRRGGLDPDQVITTEGKLLTLNAKELMEYGVADLMLLPTKVVPPTEEEIDSGTWPAEKSLLFQSPFFKAIPNATIDSYQMTWQTRFFSFLAHPVVASLLFLGLMLGFYIELNSPGFGIPGVIGLVCLFFIVLSSFSLEAANWLELLLLLLGLVLIGIEIFVIPGFGITGVLGIIISVGALLALMLPGIGQIEFEWDTGTLNAAGEVFLVRLAWLGGTVIVAVVIMVILSKFFLPKFQRFSKLVLRGEEEGYIAGPDVTKLPKVGSKGVVVSSMRPSGKVEIEADVYEAMSEGGFVDKGVKIEIVRYDGSHMIVTKIS